jgi:hypothetical protein
MLRLVLRGSLLSVLPAGCFYDPTGSFTASDATTGSEASTTSTTSTTTQPTTTSTGGQTGTESVGTTELVTTGGSDTTGEPGTGTTGELGSTGAGTTEEPDTTGEPGSTGGTTGGEDLCAPDPMDDACTMCTKMDCCEELKECYMDAPCMCFMECAQTDRNPIACIGMCPGFDINSPIVACSQGCGCG